MYLPQPADETAAPVILDHDQIEAKIDRDNAGRYQLLYAAAREALIERLRDHELGTGGRASAEKGADKVIAGYVDDLRFLAEGAGAELATNTRPLILADSFLANYHADRDALAQLDVTGPDPAAAYRAQAERLIGMPPADAAELAQAAASRLAEWAAEQ